MPELPEVETVARDLARHLVGATITGARGDWPRAIASHPTVEAFAAAVAGRRVDAVGRRAKLVVVRLSGGAALTIHLKMTGQLFVVAGAAPMDRHVHVTPRARRRSRGPVPGHPQVRPDRLLAGGPRDR